MIRFRQPIFFGGPEIYKEVYDFHNLVEETFSLCSGLQQPAHSSSEEEAEREILIRRIIKKIEIKMFAVL